MSHVPGAKIYVEQRALLPSPVLHDPVLSFHSSVQWCSRKGSLDCNLDLMQPGLVDKIIDLIEYCWVVIIETEYETAVDTDPIRLDSAYGLKVGMNLVGLPVVFHFQTVQSRL